MDALLEATSRAEGRHFWFAGFRGFVEPLLASAAGGRPNLRLLDCGCGTGGNLALLGRAGRAFGMDLSEQGLQLAKRSGHRRIARATVAALPFPDAAFDIVASFDVIYALPEPIEAAALAEMHRVLRPGGALLVNVAAMPLLRGNHSILSEELRRYTRRSLRLVLARAGFAVARLTYTNASLFPLMLIVRTAQRLMGLAATPEQAGLEITTPPPLVNAALTALLRVEARVVRRVNLPVGSSLLCLATKRAGLSGS